MATCGAVRDMNLSRMREYMQLHRRVRVADAARETGMSIPTAAKLISDLVESGEMKEVGCCASTGGRCAMVYEIDPGYLSYLLLRADSGHYSYQVRDYAGDCLESGHFSADVSTPGQIESLAKQLKQNYPNLRGICMGVKTFVSQEEAQSAPLPEAALRSFVEKHFGVPFIMENDVNAVALACWKQYGLDRGCIICLHRKNVGLVIDGKIWRGKNGSNEKNGQYRTLRPLKNIQNLPVSDDPTHYNAFAVGVYAVTLDPDLVVIYTPDDEPPCDPLAIRTLLEKRFTPEYVPDIVASKKWNDDYWQGLDMEMRAQLGIS